VKRALAEAPALAETHLAAAMVAVQEGEYQVATRALAKALDIAPTCADALEYLGRLECETGRVEAGMKRLRLAVELEPALASALVEVARAYALRGRMQEYEATVAEIERLHSRGLPPLLVLVIRVAHWTGDKERIRTAIANVPEGDQPFLTMVTAYGTGLLGEMGSDETDVMYENLVGMQTNSRFKTILCQLACEKYALEGRTDMALRYLKLAYEAALIDIDWIELCPALVNVRGDPAFAEMQRRVRRRAEQAWRA
jgi:serine/threonine-protein kinase